MILFFGAPSTIIYAVQVHRPLSSEDEAKLVWLFDGRQVLKDAVISKPFIGPRAAMVTPWSTNAVEITQNMGIDGIKRIERFTPDQKHESFDPMIYERYERLHQDMFTINIEPQPVREIEDISAYNEAEGLSLNTDEITYLEEVSERIGRKLTDSEVFGFSQVNSEHCRHKIFNGTFIIDGEEKQETLFQLIKKTSRENPNEIVSAYKDNVAFVKGPKITQFAPEKADQPSIYQERPVDSVISLKAETHNFPTTVEPFSGAATGSGGEIRDRLAGGQGSIPLAGTAVYMTAYSRTDPGRAWEAAIPERPWLYQTPLDILIKASNGASDFGNKFGQPLIAGSLLTFEHEEGDRMLAYDKVIMLAGGVGYGNLKQAQKHQPRKGDRIVVLGGDNYRIGMGGAAVSSADTGAFGAGIELNAVQRANPEMQKRVANTIRAMIESDTNDIVSIHDHGAGGHLNCLSELVEESGGRIQLEKLPIGDPTLSAKEIIGNESQERMGLVISAAHLDKLSRIAERERAPMYDVGEVTDDHRFTFYSKQSGERPMDLALSDMFGSSPETIMEDRSIRRSMTLLTYDTSKVGEYIKDVLSLEAVACKDWLTNKVDRCVGGLVAKQQCAGPLQLPLNNCGVMALDFVSNKGVATSIGHAPISSIIDPAAGARLSIIEALTNIIWAPLEKGIRSVALSANWMWPCKNEGEDARLYEAVKAVSDFAIDLGINVPTGKDSLSMKQKYSDKEVLSPGTVIISAAGACSDITKIVEPVLQKGQGAIYYIPLFNGSYDLGGSSFAQTRNSISTSCPDVMEASSVIEIFNTVQELILTNEIVAGHDISSGGLLTTLLEMCFSGVDLAASIDLSMLPEEDDVRLLLSEAPGIVFQTTGDHLEKRYPNDDFSIYKIGMVTEGTHLEIKTSSDTYNFDIPALRDQWYKPSCLLDQHQTAGDLAKARFENYKNQPLQFHFPEWHIGLKPLRPMGPRPKAAILREKGSNSEREMAHAMYLAGWEVRDVHMSDLMSGREDLNDIQFLGAVGGFSNSDVLGSAKGWAGAFLYNVKAKKALDDFFSRDDVLSVGICNGCQLFMELDLIYPEHKDKGKLTYNDSGKHESVFTSVRIEKNNSVMLSNFEGSKLGIWVSHGEGKFVLPQEESTYNIVARYGYEGYPASPNGSDYNVAMLCSEDGRHLATMPHFERSIFKWNWACYPENRDDVISPWIQAFINAREWVESKNQ